MLNLKQKNKILDLLLGTLGIVLLFEILFYHSAVTNALNSLVKFTGVWGWVSVAVLQFLQTVIIPIPATFLTLTSMKMYPNQMLLLFVVTLSSVLLGVVVSYLIGRKWGKKAVIWCAGSEEEYNKWLVVLQSNKSKIIYLLTVMLPIFPDDILCLLCGSIKMNFGWFMFCNVLGRAIGLATFLFVFKSIGNSLLTICILLPILLVTIVFKIIVKRRLKNELNSDR